MGVEYILVNQTKKETLAFYHLPGAKKRELAGGIASGALVTWYMLSNQGDDIRFISDTYDDWPFTHGSRADLSHYPDRTKDYLDTLMAERILQDDGFEYVDEQAPDSVYIKRYKNIWQES